MKSISVLIVLRICFVLWGIVYNLSKCWTCWGHSWPACVHQYNLMLPSNSALWFMKQNRNYIKKGKTLFYKKKIRRRSGAVSFLLFGSGCVILKIIPSGIISIACSLSFLVHVRHPWGSMLYLAHHFLAPFVSSSWLFCIHSYFSGYSFQPFPVAPFILGCCTPWIWHSTCPCCPPGPVFKDCFIPLGGSQFQPAV